MILNRISSFYFIDFMSSSTSLKKLLCLSFFQSCSLLTNFDPFLTNLTLFVSKAYLSVRLFYGVGGLVS
jgi:hypothetical protein